MILTRQVLADPDVRIGDAELDVTVTLLGDAARRMDSSRRMSSTPHGGLPVLGHIDDGAVRVAKEESP